MYIDPYELPDIEQDTDYDELELQIVFVLSGDYFPQTMTDPKCFPDIRITEVHGLPDDLRTSANLLYITGKATDKYYDDPWRYI